MKSKYPGIIRVIKSRRTIRKYKSTPIPMKKVTAIIEAGIWAPSAHNWQPWSFIVVKNQDLKEKFVSEMSSRSRNLYSSVKLLVKSSLEIIKNAPVIILVYNTCVFSKRLTAFGKKYATPTLISEMESVAAAIENMHLTASSMSIGMAWLTTVLFIEKDINKFFKTDKRLVAILALGYPKEKGKILNRKITRETVLFIE